MHLLIHLYLDDVIMMQVLVKLVQPISTKINLTHFVVINLISIYNKMITLLNSTGGFFPRHKFDKHHTALRVIVKRQFFDNILNKIEF